MIVVESLRKVFPNGHVALEDVSLTIGQGEIVCVIGRSGAGKSYVGTDYTATVEAMKAKRVDTAYFGPFSYVLAAQVADAKVFVVPGTADGMPTTYNSLIVTHASTGITKL